ncbi:alpha-galactosidase [Arthrobacter bambusae]|uniref:alpha-galactosidase n=1 Tax=Arthrobacter bambusae TaxID=1338426 RepID=UPI00277D2ED6|nr:alpha-galactosidase [Arthrobacter bambusae]MDQ0211645.1 alpha-galactosidase [Arthrobacter bambusae]MDQ0236211.1 alpha-galactosidase [Arthrobacter bambusae]
MDPLHLRSAGTSLVLSFDNGEAEVIHWGADLGSTLPDLAILGGPIPHSAIDVTVPAALLPQASSAWQGRPGLRGQRIADGVPGLDFSLRLRVVDVQIDSSSAVATAAAAAAVIVQQDPDAGITVTSGLTLHPGGLLELRHTAVNDGTSPFQLDELATVLPVGPDAVELLDLTGRWCRERHPQRQPVQQGTWVRTGRHGRTGHDSSLLFAAGTAGFGNRHGKVWATHLAWSGNHEQFADTMADGRTMIGGSELLGPAEIMLQPGESYTTPALFAAYSDRGLDGISEAFYNWFRSRPHHVLPAASTGLPAGKPRPVVLNTWEAVYFDHRLDTLLELAESAAELGVERFVLDDGWFRGRRDDHAGLGDWYVDRTLWPDGLTPLIHAVNSHGMEFGLWVEPEMINLDSDVARSHPDWIVGPSALSHKDGGRLPLEWRHQHIIDLVNPAAWRYVFDRIDALLRENNIKYLKWDQNRDLSEHGHAGRPSVHGQTLAAYRLFDELRKAHPGVEIESCSSGGARVDLGILERTDRIWGSDCNDALERQTIQRWTGVVVPPELVGGHIGPTTSHTTARTHDLSFRAITAMFGHFGMEWDVRQVQGAEREELKRFIGLYKEHRGLVHSGRMVRADVPDDSLMVHGVVSDDGGSALFAVVSTRTSFAEQPGRVAIPGLDPERSYMVQAIFPAPGDADYARTFTQVQPPAWLPSGAEASGRFLAEVGLPMPVLNPEHALLLRITAV